MRNKILGLILISAFSFQLSAFAADPPVPLLASGGVLRVPPVISVGEPINVNGQVFLIGTNADGLLTITTSGPNGSASVTPPSNPAEILQRVQEIIAANNPDNKVYYGEKEIVARVGVAYLQNSGQAVAEIGCRPESGRRDEVLPSSPRSDLRPPT